MRTSLGSAQKSSCSCSCFALQRPAGHHHHVHHHHVQQQHVQQQHVQQQHVQQQHVQQMRSRNRSGVEAV
jgi:hypothetical protein